ncbi:MAG: gluconate kinase [Bacteroidetes bacterium]|nr:MAG: gluconate kinase [Bacteroidota bacterium]
MSVIIGVDIGTTHIKVIAYTRDGVVLHDEKSICKTIQPSPEIAEQDPRAIFDSLIKLLQCVFVAVRNEQIEGICFSAGMHSMIVLNEKGEPITNAILWGDTRSIKQAKKLKENGMANKLYAVSAVPVHPVLPLCKIMWLQENQPEIFISAKKFVSIKEYIFFRLFGKFIVDYSIAASSGMMDIKSLNWNKEALKIANITTDHLSEIVPSTHSELDMSAEFAKMLSMEKPVPFIIGSSDGCLANIGTGVFASDKSALTIGTSGAVRTSGNKPIFHPRQKLFCYPLSKDLFVTGGPTNNGGYVLQWFAKNILGRELNSENDFENFVREAQEVEPGAGGLVFLPYLQGERAPVWDAEARGVFFGLNAVHQRAHMMRAILEGINFSLYDIFLGLEETIGKIETVCASGGFVQSDLWLQMLADIFNKKVRVTKIADASAIGASMLGFFATGSVKDWKELEDKIPVGKIYYPDTKEHVKYRKNFAIFRELYPAMKSTFEKLSE